MSNHASFPGALGWTILSIIIVALDQLTKSWASTNLEYAVPQAVMPFFNLTLLHNTGAAFSFLADAGGWQRWFFSGLAVVVSVVLLVWLARLPARRYTLAIALALVLGGALGNVWDRLMNGYVVDFIDIYYQSWHWPAFNIADMAISLGAILLIVDAIFYHEDKEN
jgi:signal peptidase II